MVYEKGVIRFSAEQREHLNRMEVFVEKMGEPSKGITPHMGKIIVNAIRRSPWRDSSKATILNIRYAFAKNPDFNYEVPESVAKFLEFLESEPEIFWNEVFMQMETIWREN